jgi:hypothetical protein
MTASVSRGRPYRRIATEEVWISPELLALYQKMLKQGSANDPRFESLWRHYGLGMISANGASATWTLPG